MLRELLRSTKKAVLGAPAPIPFTKSSDYWESRYAAGGNSGDGSYNHLARFKADILNEFVADNQLETVIEFGCGDGNQLTMASYPKYLGVDVSATAVATCKELFRYNRKRSFMTLDKYDGQQADLSMSLDVIFHLVEDDVFDAYMRTLFDASNEFVVIYSSNHDNNVGTADHVRHRKFTDWIEKNRPDWALYKKIDNTFQYDGDWHNTSFADFYIFLRPFDGR
jgi:cyclopropane fatty-acyl-phospholipid synthase-like methyltransferase